MTEDGRQMARSTRKQGGFDFPAEIRGWSVASPTLGPAAVSPGGRSGFPKGIKDFQAGSPKIPVVSGDKH